MGKFVINGGRRLYGTATVQGSKNAVLPILAACILASGDVIIDNVPLLADVENMGRILQTLGASFDRIGNTVRVNSDSIDSAEIQSPLVKEIRSSIFLLGSVLGRKKYAHVTYPGGCDIGIRPIDIHIKALREMNVYVEEKSGQIYCDAENIRPAQIVLDYPSVGATENVILAATTLDGVTKIINAAREPEIVDLQNFINKMGGKVKGAGTPVIEITGVNKLNGVRYKVMPDRIVAGTLLIAAALTGGWLQIKGCSGDYIGALISKMSKTSCNIKLNGDSIEVLARKRRYAVEQVETQPYPGFPTDLQAPMVALLAVSPGGQGVSVVRENIFENRFRYTRELTKMGAKIRLQDRSAIISGIPRLSGAEVTAHDLRGGAALVLAGLNACGTTVVNDIHHIDRGYESLENTMRQLGADIRRI